MSYPIHVRAGCLALLPLLGCMEPPTVPSDATSTPIAGAASSAGGAGAGGAGTSANSGAGRSAAGTGGSVASGTGNSAGSRASAGAGASAPVQTQPNVPQAGTPARNVPPECSDLSVCCVRVTNAAERQLCTNTADSAAAASCSSAAAMYCGQATPPDAGTGTMPTNPTNPPPQDTPTTPSCVMLAECCAELTDNDAQEDCQRAVEDDDARDCDQAREELCASTTPPPTTPPTTPPASGPCGELATCCATVTDENDREDCDEDVTEGNENRCIRTHDDLCPGTRTLPEPTTAACISLGMCCATLQDQEALADCKLVASEDDDNDCEEANEDLCQ